MWSIRNAVLATLLAQNAVYTLLRRYSQGILLEIYSSEEVLLVGEVIKLLVSAYMIARSTEPCDADCAGESSVSKLLWTARKSGKMLVLAMIYGLMNSLSFIAIRRIDAAAFTVCAQLKILATASFAVIILHRRLTVTQWRALITLVLGAILVTVPTGCEVSPSKTNEEAGESDLTLQEEEGLSLLASVEGDVSVDWRAVIGYTAVLVEVTLSGFASIYFEKVIKRSPEKLTIWHRNFQLALHSSWLYTMAILLNGGGEAGFGGGWSPLACVIALLGAFGGILVALSVKYADSILKTMATAGSILVATTAGHFLLDGPLDTPMIIGASVVVSSVLNYNLDATPPTNLSGMMTPLTAPPGQTDEKRAEKSLADRSLAERTMSVDRATWVEEESRENMTTSPVVEGGGREGRSRVKHLRE